MTTGSTVNGTVPGMANGLGGFGASGIDVGNIMNVQGDPTDIVQAAYAYQIAWDGAAAQGYQALTAGSTWVKIGSVA